MLKTHGRYDYSAISRRPDYSWPGGKRLAVHIALNVEHFAFGEGLGNDYAVDLPKGTTVRLYSGFNTRGEFLALEGMPNARDLVLCAADNCNTPFSALQCPLANASYASLFCGGGEPTLERRRVVFWSRSRSRLWEKGETSGNHLALVEIHTDCDRDTLLVLAEPAGPVCHLGTLSCFGDGSGPAAAPLAFLAQLESIVESRVAAASTEASYTARLVAAGPQRMAQKVGEEGLEVALAAVCETDEKLVGESADLVFHLLVLLRARGLGLADVVAELARRHTARD